MLQQIAWTIGLGESCSASSEAFCMHWGIARFISLKNADGFALINSKYK